MYESGMTEREIVTDLGVPLHVVKAYRRLAGVDARSYTERNLLVYAPENARGRRRWAENEAVVRAMRERGEPVTSRWVCDRFGWERKATRRRLNTMRERGLIRVHHAFGKERWWEPGRDPLAVLSSPAEVGGRPGGAIKHKMSLPGPPLAQAVIAAANRSAGMAWDADVAPKHDSRAGLLMDQAGSSSRALYRLREGERVGFDTADRILTALELAWWDVWREPGPLPQPIGRGRPVDVLAWLERSMLWVEADAAYRAARKLFTGEAS